MLISPAFTLVLVSALFAVISQVMQVTLTNRKELRKTQKEMKEKNNQLKELMKKGDASKAEAEQVQKEMMELTTQNMKSLPKMMVANMIVLLPLFWMVSDAYHGIKFTLPFPLSLIWDQGEWFWVYVLCSFLISMFVNQVLTRYEEHHEKKKDRINQNPNAHNQTQKMNL